MPMTAGERITVLIKRRGWNIAKLAESISIMFPDHATSPQNLANKLRRDNFTEQELHRIAQALGCNYKSSFVMIDTGEEV